MLGVTLQWTSIPSRLKKKYSLILHGKETRISCGLMCLLDSMVHFCSSLSAFVHDFNNFALFLQEYKLLHPVVSKHERERQKRQKKKETLLEQFDEIEVNRKTYNEKGI